MSLFSSKNGRHEAPASGRRMRKSASAREPGRAAPKRTNGLRVFFSALWVVLLVVLGVYFCAFAPREGVYNERENRLLANAPDFSAKSIFGGALDTETEAYLSDHIPAREGAIRLSNALRDMLSIASYEDGLAIAGKQEDALTSAAPDADILDDMISVFDQPAVTPTPSGSETDTPTPDGTVPPDPTETPDDEPVVETPSVPRREKPAVSPDDYPEILSVYTETNSGRATYYSYGRSNVLAVTSVLNRVAALLPEDGSLVYTMVPQASIGNLYVAAAEKKAFVSETEAVVDAFGSEKVTAISSAAILGEAIKNDEYVYFRTDMHWTPYGTYLVYCKMLEAIGMTPAAREDFSIEIEEPFRGTYYRDNPTNYMYNNPDRLELLQPRFPLEWRRITGPDGQYKLIDFLNWNAAANDRYTIYLGGPTGPWTYAQCDNGQTKNCLVITDSFGLAFVPLMTQNYAQVHYYDPRYFNGGIVGASAKEMIEAYDITDVFEVVGDLHSYNSDFILGQLNTQLGD